MAGEIIRVFGTEKVLEANGDSVSSGNLGLANDANYSTSVDGGNYPDAEFIMSFQFSVSPTENGQIIVIARQLSLIGSNDARPPEATRTDRVVGSVVIDNTTDTQYASFFAKNIPRNASYYILNQGSGQTIAAGWTLKVVPMTFSVA